MRQSTRELGAEGWGLNFSVMGTVTCRGWSMWTVLKRRVERSCDSHSIYDRNYYILKLLDDGAGGAEGWPSRPAMRGRARCLSRRACVLRGLRADGLSVQSARGRGAWGRLRQVEKLRTD